MYYWFDAGHLSDQVSVFYLKHADTVSFPGVPNFLWWWGEEAIKLTILFWVMHILQILQSSGSRPRGQDPSVGSHIAGLKKKHVCATLSYVYFLRLVLKAWKQVPKKELCAVSEARRRDFLFSLWGFQATSKHCTYIPCKLNCFRCVFQIFVCQASVQAVSPLLVLMLS